MTKLTLATLALIAAPALAMADCPMKHQTTASACGDGQVYDTATKACTTVTG
ncbi:MULTISPECIES: hypothetical protein [Cereibacter]|jgi:hypothetical protein|uniref:Adenylosuccinate lyase n=1 Tax=Cereibacter johrii TaxID=445629 RepID=A0ABX5JDN9_9RHOB|nr:MULTISPECIES: hypothetical protein [Cereibacter]ABN76007.1 hypothetical protein Rsph17029_0896 [Cereibacter sphaeroides ATCC 17029]RDS96112.1 hypothetical protein DWF04_09045 [Cereibacter sphaeroides f. sp. denitrificans]PTM81598.1 hypothetical protein C8J29_101542 [Cereibacter johrii]RAZ87697.1 hypothetical protein DDV93_00660 [Cereibacter johrii]RIA00101.1 hypothetical protein D1122_04945 [Cereibacter sphaeroides]